MKASFDVLMSDSTLSGSSDEMYLILSCTSSGIGAISLNWSNISPSVVMSTSRSKSPAGEREGERTMNECEIMTRNSRAGN